jgi:thermitase
MGLGGISMKKLLSVFAVFAFFSANAAEYIVKFKDASKLIRKSVNVKGIGNIAFTDVHEPGAIAKINLESKSASYEAQVIAKLLANPDIEYVTKSFKLRTNNQVDLSKLKEQWAIKKVQAEKAWNLAGNLGSKNVVVAVIDTGVDSKHESLRDNTVPGYDFKDNDNDPHDEADPNWQQTHKNPGHGTHCAGIVGATGVVQGGIVGLSPNVSIMPLRFLGVDGSGDLMAAIKSMDYAIDKKVDVVSASWGAEVPASQATPLIEAVKRVSDAGIIMVSAAGNGDRSGVGFSNDERDEYPANANFENTITVAASDENDAKTSFSNFGRKSVHVAAPGFKIMSTLPDNKYALLSGTSMATPLVAGLVALMKAQNKDLTGMQARSIMQQTGVKTAIETACNCRIDASAAIESLKNAKPVLVPYAYTLSPGSSVKFEVLNASGAVTYTSSNPQVAAIDGAGNLTASSEGETKVTATDADGNKLSSDSIFVWKRSESSGGAGGCPLGDPTLCDLLCKISPTLPWCKSTK